MTQNQNAKKVQQVLEEKFQASNLGVNKIILNINGGNSNFPTNKNSEIQYSLEQPLVLEMGDTVTLLQSFVEEKGLQSNTISFEEDISAEMRFMYYKQADCGDQTTSFKDVEFVKYPKFFPDFYNNLQGARPAGKDELALPNSLVKGNWIETLDSANTHYGVLSGDDDGVYPMSVMKGDCNLNMSSNGAEYLETAVNNISSGCNGQPQYLMEEVKYDGVFDSVPPFYRPVYGSKTITIKAGNYSLDAISNIISSQLNGSIGINNNLQSNAMLDKMYIPTASANGQSFLQNTTPFFNNIDVNLSSKNDESIIGTNNEKPGYERRIEGLVRELQYGKESFYENFEFSKLGAVNSKTDASASLQQREDETIPFPNGSTAVPQTDGNGQTNLRESQQDKVMGFNKPNNFYINRSHLYQLFERDGHFYDTPDQFTKPTDNNSYIKFYSVGGNRPPTMRELFNIRVTSVSGVIPFFAEVPGPLTPANKNRIAKLPDMDIFSSFFPVITVKDTSKESQPQKFGGTSVAELQYDSSISDRFSFKNFHEFYKMPSLTADASATSNYGAQQATKYNNPYSQITRQITFTEPLDVDIVSDGKAFTNAVYPIDSSSGVCINNFDFDLVKTTKVYIDLVASIQAIDVSTLNGNWKKERLIYELFTKPFDKFFASVSDAKAAWSKSLWSRLGFDYNQLGDISSNLEQISTAGGAYSHETKEFDKVTPAQFDGDYYHRMILPQKGLITHNQFDFSQIVASNGLGEGNPVQISGVGTPLQTYTLQGYYLGSELTQDGIAPNTIVLLETSKKLEAKSLPSLSNNKSYLVIESDIVNINYKDTKANWGNILGIMSKENSTNDTLFGAGQIEFVVTQEKLLTDIRIIIKNPDGTLVNDNVIGQNNAFIIQITKAIKPAILPILTL
mgnify:FL=1